LGKGDIDGAVNDKIATQRLGRQVLNQGIFVNYLVGLAIEGIAYAEGIAGNLDAQPTAEQIRRLMKLQAELPPAMTMQEVLESERILVLDSLQNYAQGKPFSPEDNIPPVLVFLMGGGIPMDWNIVFTRANQFIDGEWKPTIARPTPGGVAGSFLQSVFSRNKRSENFIGVLMAQFLSAIDAAEEAKRRLDCCNNMQRITLAMLLYHAEHGTLPPAYSTDTNGQPLHSWRVLLLPYLEDERLAALHGRIRPDEPWDSEYNRQFHTQCPDIYRCPTHGLEPGETAYCVIPGEETPFDASGNGSGIGKSLTGFGPESDGMILVAETRQSGNWMNPGFDVPFEQAKTGISGKPDSGNVIGSYHVGGANFGLRNGAVTFLSETIAPEVWEKVMTGKERVR
jgi:hypothetical protein